MEKKYLEPVEQRYKGFYKAKCEGSLNFDNTIHEYHVLAEIFGFMQELKKWEYEVDNELDNVDDIERR